MKNLLKLILAVIFLTGVGMTSFHFLLSSQLKQDKLINARPDGLFGWKFPVAKFPSTGPADLLAYSDIRDPGGIAQGLPVRLKIPIIGVDSAIEDAFITPEGRMDVPQGSVNVAWFALGPKPGYIGSAVIGGHYGIRKGVPFVFYNLDKIKVGDKVYVVNDKGDTLAFEVRAIQLFDRNADATLVFTSSDNVAHLNIITCEGIWNRVNGTYPSRRVIFTDAISAEGAEAAISVFPRPLNIGMRGADVIALQTALEQKGLLKMPSGVAKGFFGTLTRAAVTKYQKSVGLRSDGIFDLSTRAKLIPEQPKVVVKPTFPSTALTMPNPTPFFQTVLKYVKSLHVNPLDALITLLLLAAIIFMAFKIKKQ